MVEDEDAARAVAVGRAERAHEVDAVGTAVHGVRRGVAGRFASSSGSITFTIAGARGSGLVSRMWIRDELMPGTIR